MGHATWNVWSTVLELDRQGWGLGYLRKHSFSEPHCLCLPVMDNNAFLARDFPGGPVA